MNDRIRYLREDAIANPAQDLFSKEMRYQYAKGWYDAESIWYLPARQTAARKAMLVNMTPVINEWELIVGRQNFTVQLTPEQEEFLKLAEHVMPRYIGQEGHMAPDYEKLLRLGTDGVREEIAQHKAALDTRANPDDLEKEAFYDNCLTMLGALDTLAARYAEHARKLTETAKPERAKELRTIAENLDVVPKHPAKTFWQALQAIEMFIFHLGNLYQLGRPDRYLLPYYNRDIESGILTREKALELIDCICLQYDKTVPKGLAVGLMVGGRTLEGDTVENELTYLFLESIMDTRLPYPGIGLCVTKDTSDKALRLAAKALGEGCTHPALFNDEVIVRGLQNYGLPLQDAVQYIHSTCVEITPVACSAVWVASPYHNLVQPLLDMILENALPETFEECVNVYGDRLKERIYEGAREQNLARLNRHLHFTHPLVSCFVNDCLARGKDLDHGGARYAWIEPSFVGMANLADSLIAVKKLVYEEKSVTPEVYKAALENDFKGYEWLLRKIESLPRYGNDDPEADAFARYIAEKLPQEVTKIPMCYGEKMMPSMFCWIMHAELGSKTGATPDGRRAGFPLGDGSGPAQGREHNGPTASILSSTCWNHTPFIGGIAVNLKFAKHMFSEESVDRLISMIRVFMARGGFELQVNTVDREVLLDAKIHPEAHKDLVVRIGGYSDYFTNLPVSMQDEVLLRTEHEA